MHFGPFELDIANARLARAGEAVPLSPRALDLLAFLARRAGQLVTKDELLDQVWGRRFITEGVIKTAMSELRAALGDDARSPQWLETVPRRGYRFIGRLAARPADAARQAVPAAEAAPAPPAVGNLPALRSPLLGREADLRALTPLLQTGCLVTVVGPGGVGKTQLALELARASGAGFADGAWLIDLAPLPAGAGAGPLIRGAVAQVLQLGPDAAADDAALVQALTPLRALLLLDNAEHVLDPLARLLVPLFSAPGSGRGPGLLVTSQEPLQLTGERVHRLAPLALPADAEEPDPARLLEQPALRLFVERVAARLPGFTLAPHQQQAVHDICRLLDGLPLALELAAARVPLLGVHGLLERLAAGHAGSGTVPLALLSQGARDVAPRHRSLLQTLQWSHALLTEAEQRVFRRLAVFQAGFTAEAAEAVCADEAMPPAQVLEALGALVDKSFVVAEEPTPPLPRRLRLLEAPRAFAIACAHAAGEMPALQARHAEAMLAHLHRAFEAQTQRTDPLWLERHAQELPNLRGALQWSSAQPARRVLAATLLERGARIWLHTRALGECQHWLDRLRGAAGHGRTELLEQAQQADEAVHARLAVVQASLAIFGDEPPAPALDALVAALPWLAEHTPPAEHYWGLHLRYVLMLRVQPEADRRPLLAQAQALEQPHWSAGITATGRMDRAHEAYLRGDTEAYLRFAREEWRARRAEGALRDSWPVAQMLMPAEYLAGRIDAALAVGRQVLHESRQAHSLRYQSSSYALYLQMLAEAGSGAAELVAELRDTVPDLLLHRGQLWMLSLALPWAAWHQGRTGAAAQLLGWRDAAMRRVGEGMVGPYTRRSRALLHERLAAALSAEALSQRMAEGEALDDSAALQLTLAPDHEPG